jgi:hypothetical protein
MSSNTQLLALWTPSRGVFNVVRGMPANVSSTRGNTRAMLSNFKASLTIWGTGYGSVVPILVRMAMDLDVPAS